LVRHGKIHLFPSWIERAGKNRRNRNKMTRLIGLTILLTGVAGYALAGSAPSPEIDASSAVGAVALISGGILVLRTRRRGKP
jgi:hypothetical protein